MPEHTHEVSRGLGWKERTWDCTTADPGYHMTVRMTLVSWRRVRRILVVGIEGLVWAQAMMEEGGKESIVRQSREPDRTMEVKLTCAYSNYTRDSFA